MSPTSSSSEAETLFLLTLHIPGTAWGPGSPSLPSSYKGPGSKSSHQPEHDQPHRAQREPGSRSFYLEMIEITPGHNFLDKVQNTPKLNFSGVKEGKVDNAQLLAQPYHNFSSEL